MELRFPELRGGPVQGLNDAGVENFQGSIDDYLARECGQNTGDALASGVTTARLEFDRVAIPAQDIPAIDGIRRTLAACLAKWNGKPKERVFFEEAVRLANLPTIDVLRISDFGTTGLSGTDAEETGRWFALVKSQGVSNKEDTAAGSFGIGKSSPFAASHFRTVFYGTRLEDGSTAFQGVCRLVTHRNEDGKLTQGTGYVGQFDPVGGDDGEPIFRAERSEHRIPGLFNRSKAGTDIWVVGYRSGDDWGTNLTRSILSNFWPAIFGGGIEFRVGDLLITRDNCLDLISEHQNDPGFDAHFYAQAILNQPIRKHLTYAGSCELYLTTAIAELPRRICMARRSGMRIYDYAPKACRVPFAGLFICKDPDGNRLLRNLEPPKHDTWDPNRSEDGIGKRALDEIKLWIREEVKKLNPLHSGSSFNEAELAKYLPDNPSDTEEDGSGDESTTPDRETLESRPAKEPPRVTAVSAPPQARNAEEPGDEGGPQGEGSGTNEPGGSGSGQGGSEGTHNSNAMPLKIRAYQRGRSSDYEVVVRPDADVLGKIEFLACGEDGRHEPIAVLSARTDGEPGSDIPATGSCIGPISLRAGTPQKISLKLTTATKRSLVARVRL